MAAIMTTPAVKERRRIALKWMPHQLHSTIQLNRLKRMTRMFTARDPQAVALYSDYLAYKCQLALYEIWSAESSLSWEEFIRVAKESGKIRETARRVVHSALISFDSSHYDFELPDRVQFFQDESRKIIYAAPVFSKREGEMFVRLFMLQTEMAHRSYLTHQR